MCGPTLLRPSCTRSLPTTMTIGIVEVAALAAISGGVPPATIYGHLSTNEIGCHPVQRRLFAGYACCPGRGQNQPPMKTVCLNNRGPPAAREWGVRQVDRPGPQLSSRYRCTPARSVSPEWFPSLRPDVPGLVGRCGMRCCARGRSGTRRRAASTQGHLLKGKAVGCGAFEGRCPATARRRGSDEVMDSHRARSCELLVLSLSPTPPPPIADAKHSERFTALEIPLSRIELNNGNRGFFMSPKGPPICPSPWSGRPVPSPTRRCSNPGCGPSTRPTPSVTSR